MQIELVESEALLLLQMLNQRVVDCGQKVAPVESSLMVKLLQARTAEIKAGAEAPVAVSS